MTLDQLIVLLTVFEIAAACAVAVWAVIIWRGDYIERANRALHKRLREWTKP